jgi:16S rRNA A1518/A1519 N6-dimethyltransferase RsmA/KsgA/DIM1 with predicted DNA glycosylase/AP lyase activity
LEDLNNQSDELTNYTAEVNNDFEAEKEKPRLIAAEIDHRINTLNSQISKHFNHQHIENDKMQTDLTELNGDKESINMTLVECEARIKDIHARIGYEIPVEGMEY